MKNLESHPREDGPATLEGVLEEMLAEDKRKAFVMEFHQRVNEQLFWEGERDRRKDAEAKRRLAERIAEIEKEADRDPLLTELLNRRGFERTLREIRDTGATGALLMLDIDKFKDINDEYGHPVGDLVLRAVAQRLKGVCRESDQIARWGGEEFLVLFPGATAEDVQKKFTPEGAERAGITIRFEKEGSEAPKLDITFSGGITDLGIQEDLDEALTRADKTLYEIKQSGRNRLEIASTQP